MCERSVYDREANDWNSLSVYEKSLESYKKSKMSTHAIMNTMLHVCKYMFMYVMFMFICKYV